MCYNTFRYHTCRHITDDYIEFCATRQTVGVCDTYSVAPHFGGTNCPTCVAQGIKPEDTIWRRWRISEKQWLKDLVQSKSYRPEWLKFKWTAAEMASTQRRIQVAAQREKDIREGRFPRASSTQLAEKMLGVDTSGYYTNLNPQNPGQYPFINDQTDPNLSGRSRH